MRGPCDDVTRIGHPFRVKVNALEEGHKNFKLTVMQGLSVK